jgi:transcription-repair coupling factor (superfamily II helicase)
METTVQCDSISRFKPRQQKEIVKNSAGETDILIGAMAHQQGREVRGPGLVVIDEERCSGVTHKERSRCERRWTC